MCWQGKMHLGTLDMSLRDFDEELCSGFSRVYEDWWMIRLPDSTKMRICKDGGYGYMTVLLCDDNL